MGKDETGVIVQRSTGDERLISPEHIEEIERIRHLLFSRVRKPYELPTPPENTKQRENGYLYPEYAIMLERMDRFHPIRKEEVSFIPTTDLHSITAIAVVTDLLTGEVRTGVDSHRITFKKDVQKTHDAIVDVGNDYKSATTEALRNAYSRFGICADIYDRVPFVPPTEAQSAEFLKIESLITPRLSSSAFKSYWEGIKSQWKTQTETSSEAFLANLKKVLKLS